MPIRINPMPASTREELLSAAVRVVTTGLALLPESISDLQFVSVLPVQYLALHENVQLKTTGPEGHRALFSSGGHIVAALDFYHSAGRLNFSHTVTGRHLDQLVAGLNALAELYVGNKKSYQVACVDFHYADHPYFLVWTDKRPILYAYFNDGLVRVPHERIKTLLHHFGKKRKKTP